MPACMQLRAELCHLKLGAVGTLTWWSVYYHDQGLLECHNVIKACLWSIAFINLWLS